MFLNTRALQEECFSFRGLWRVSFWALRLRDALFPLTPALSLGERENCHPSWLQEGALGWNKHGKAAGTVALQDLAEFSDAL
jgi:hypothetical protein